METSYRVAEFAQLAGITVRTLHHYDQIGLLEPSYITSSGHRRYHRRDLLRLQQILTLKWMGFSLQEIKTMLDSPSYDLQQSLSIQKEAIDRQIAQLQAASTALDQAMQKAEEYGAEALDAQTITTIIHGITATEPSGWMRQYYSEAAAAIITARRFAFSQEEIERSQQQWQAIYDGFNQHRNLPPDHPTLQQFAAQMHALVQAFTGGDPEVEAGLRRVSEDVRAGKKPEGVQWRHPSEGLDDDVRELMEKTIAIYRAQVGKNT